MDRNMAELEKQITLLEIHERKRNLLIYGLPVKSSAENENTDYVVRDLLKTRLKINPTTVEAMRFINVHRLGQPRKDPATASTTASSSSAAPPAIIVAFVQQIEILC